MSTAFDYLESNHQKLAAISIISMEEAVQINSTSNTETFCNPNDIHHPESSTGHESQKQCQEAL